MIPRPAASEYPPFFATYVDKVPEGDILQQLSNQIEDMRHCFGALTPEQAEYRYAPGKWSLKDILGHLADGERIFAYRALRFARSDRTNLPGFDQDTYVTSGEFQNRSVGSLLDEFILQRQANIILFSSMDEDTLARSGMADGKDITVQSILYIQVGHIIHHIQVVKVRYQESYQFYTSG